MKDITFAIITISDRSSQGERPDLSGPALVEYIHSQQGLVKFTSIIPDEIGRIKSELSFLSANPEIQIILTSGGTGLSPRDVTPQATLEVADVIVPGISEYIRYRSIEFTLHAMLSRGVCVVKNQSLIINLPGSPKGALESLQMVEAILPHAIAQLRNLPNAQDHTLKH
ncbi:MAG: molybdenum cofactor biosynthesis protein [Anaerolinea sp.]|nr:molybdenum cofactor biosynthesis protein [Anaerolinea sp.]